MVKRTLFDIARFKKNSVAYYIKATTIKGLRAKIRMHKKYAEKIILAKSTQLTIEEFKVKLVSKSPKTGKIIYTNNRDLSIYEDNLFEKDH